MSDPVYDAGTITIQKQRLLDRLPFRATIYRRDSSIEAGSDWIGPSYDTVVLTEVPCLISWRSALYENLPLGDYSDNSALLIMPPDADIEFRDRIVVTIGEREYTFVVENQPRVYYHPHTWTPHHIEAGLKEVQ